MVIKVDQTPPPKLIETLSAKQNIVRVRSVSLPKR
jgi:hypothetical protein